MIITLQSQLSPKPMGTSTPPMLPLLQERGKGSNIWAGKKMAHHNHVLYQLCWQKTWTKCNSLTNRCLLNIWSMASLRKGLLTQHYWYFELDNSWHGRLACVSLDIEQHPVLWLLDASLKTSKSVFILHQNFVQLRTTGLWYLNQILLILKLNKAHHGNGSQENSTFFGIQLWIHEQGLHPDSDLLLPYSYFPFYSFIPNSQGCHPLNNNRLKHWKRPHSWAIKDALISHWIFLLWVKFFV